MPSKRITLSVVNQEIDKYFPNVRLARGEGYFYIYSDDPTTAIKIAGLYQSGIYESRIHNISLEKWIEAIKFLMVDGWRKKF